jgi:DNA-binding HxlR family transcriptional regulator
MEREGLVTKKIYPEIPPKGEYALTIRAKELEVILKELAGWANRWRSAGTSKNMTTIAVLKKPS